MKLNEVLKTLCLRQMRSLLSSSLEEFLPYKYLLCQDRDLYLNLIKRNSAFFDPQYIRTEDVDFFIKNLNFKQLSVFYKKPLVIEKLHLSCFTKEQLLEMLPKLKESLQFKIKQYLMLDIDFNLDFTAWNTIEINHLHTLINTKNYEFVRNNFIQFFRKHFDLFRDLTMKELRILEDLKLLNLVDPETHEFLADLDEESKEDSLGEFAVKYFNANLPTKNVNLFFQYFPKMKFLGDLDALADGFELKGKHLEFKYLSGDVVKLISDMKIHRHKLKFMKLAMENDVFDSFDHNWTNDDVLFCKTLQNWNKFRIVLLNPKTRKEKLSCFKDDPFYVTNSMRPIFSVKEYDEYLNTYKNDSVRMFYLENFLYRF